MSRIKDRGHSLLPSVPNGMSQTVSGAVLSFRLNKMRIPGNGTEKHDSRTGCNRGRGGRSMNESDQTEIQLTEETINTFLEEMTARNCKLDSVISCRQTLNCLA